MKKSYNITTIQMYDEVTADMLDTVAYATISNSEGSFVGTDVPAIPDQTYDIDISLDGGAVKQIAVAILNTDDWDSILADIETELRILTSSTETVAIADGKITVTSATEGSGSSVLIEDGTAGSAGGGLLAAIDAIEGYTTVLDTPVPGREGTITFQVTNSLPSDEFKFNYQVKTALGVEKAGLVSSYDHSTGILSIADLGIVTELEDGDQVFVSGVFMKGI